MIDIILVVFIPFFKSVFGEYFLEAIASETNFEIVLFLNRIKIFPAIPNNGNDHGSFGDDFIENTCPGTNNDIIHDPQGRVNEHTGDTNFACVIRISADRSGDIRGNREDRPPAVPSEDQCDDLKCTDDTTHNAAFQKCIFTAQTERSYGV